MSDIQQPHALVPELPVKRYSSGSNNKSFVETIGSLRKEFSGAHSLGFRFAERNIRAKYRQSVFGVIWAFLPPLATAMVWIILNQNNIVKLSFGSAQVSYPLFVITGTLLWSVFANSVLMPLQSIQSNRVILVKINFPREALMISAFYEILFNTCIALLIIIIELLVFRVHLNINSFLFIPSLLILIVLGMGLGMLLLPVALLYRDVQFILPTLLQFAMYLTPVIYSKPLYAGLTKILKYNFVTPVLTNARAWLLGIDSAVPAWHVFAVAMIAFFLFAVGFFLQKITLQVQIERMGS